MVSFLINKLKIFIKKIIIIMTRTPPKPHKFVEMSLICGFSGPDPDPNNKGKGKALQDQDSQDQDSHDEYSHDEDFQDEYFQEEVTQDKGKGKAIEKQESVEDKGKGKVIEEQNVEQESIQEQNVQQDNDTLLAQQRLNYLHKENQRHESIIDCLKQEQKNFRSEIQSHLDNIPKINQGRDEAIRNIETINRDNNTNFSTDPFFNPSDPQEIARSKQNISIANAQHEYVQYTEKARSKLISIKDKLIQEEEQDVEKNKKEMADLYDRFELSSPLKSSSNPNASSSSNVPTSSSSNPNVSSSSNVPINSPSNPNNSSGSSPNSPLSENPSKKPKLDLYNNKKSDLNTPTDYDSFGGFKTGYNGYDILHDILQIFDNYPFIFTICFLLLRS